MVHVAHLKWVIFSAGILLIAVLGATLSQTTEGLYLEEELGLSWLFTLRGTLASPKNIIIISVDQVSAEILRLGENPEKWPRSYYTNLIDKLNQQNPAIIAFNIHFSENQSESADNALAQAMVASRKIILSNYLKQYTPLGIDPNGEFSYERIINPIPIFQNAALSSSPFPLAKSTSTIKTFWTYKSSAGDIPTFPVTVFQYYVFKEGYTEIKRLLKKINPGLANSLPETFPPIEHIPQIDQLSSCDQIIARVKLGILQSEQTRQDFTQLLLAEQIPIVKSGLIKAWLSLLQSGESLYLNHYGKAGTITTIPFYQVLVAEFLTPELFKNSIVMVGYSDQLEPEKNQGFFTAFSTDANDTLSPIEIAATAVANLVEHSWITPISEDTQLAIIFLWGIILAVVVSGIQNKNVFPVIFICSALYIGVAVWIFAFYSLWIPLFFPIAVQIPLVLLIAAILLYFKGKLERILIQRTFSHYIPSNVVNSLSQQPKINELHTYGELLKGVCMATDAAEYTALGEILNPSELNQLMNRYYDIMFPLVKHNQGIVSDVVGDAMLAVWASASADKQLKIKACESALIIQAAIEQFNVTQVHQLHTRIGLHFGDMRLGNVGAQDHFEYRAVGDVVNTATRIEGLNKFLGTQILVSWHVIHDLDVFYCREVGAFIFKGKTQPVVLFELLHRVGQVESYCPILAEEFLQALRCFQEYRWLEALELFLNLQHKFPLDGPTLFYIRYLQHFLPRLPQPNERSAIAVIDVGSHLMTLTLG